MRTLEARRRWSVAYWLLFAAFVGTAALNMLRIRAGVLTSYAADVVVPAWLYIYLRGLHQPTRAALVQRLFGRTPGLTAAVLFLASAATELTQRYWPAGPFAGRYDPVDIAAFGTGLAACYAADRATRRAAAGERNVAADAALAHPGTTPADRIERRCPCRPRGLGAAQPNWGVSAHHTSACHQ